MNKMECSCPSHVDSTEELCPACHAEWEDWMESVAMPQARAAFAREDALSRAIDHYGLADRREREDARYAA